MRVAWLTWLPINGWAAVALQKHLNGNGDPVDLVTIEPKKNLSPGQALEIVADLSKEYDAVALMPNAVLLEAARNFKIQNFERKGPHLPAGSAPIFTERRARPGPSVGAKLAKGGFMERHYRQFSYPGGGVQYQVITAVGFHWRHIAIVSVKNGKASKADRYFFSTRVPEVILPFEVLGRDFIEKVCREQREIIEAHKMAAGTMRLLEDLYG